MKEIWKDSVSMKGYFQVSNLGRIKSVDRIVNSSFGATRKIKGRILDHRPMDGGYKRISIKINGKYKGFLIHRLVAEAFLTNHKNLPHINHKDGNRLNNHIDNLEWCTHQENMRHAVDSGLNGCLRSVVCDCGGHGKWYPSQADASRDTGVSKPCICAALKGNQATAGGMRWFYA